MDGKCIYRLERVKGRGRKRERGEWDWKEGLKGDKREEASKCA
jgi:hypothetical protein